MSELIKCPSCGENNPSDLEFCQYCQARLQPLTGALKGADQPIKPGQAPTPKSTSELEPILPQWLRDARESARQDEQAVEKSEEPAQPASSPAPDDFLAGLRSQAAEEEEEMPDWLASITGSVDKSKEPQADTSEVRWVELGDKDDASESSENAPGWLAGLHPAEPQTDEKGEVTDWLHSESQPVQSSQLEDVPAPDFSPPAADDTPDWLRQMAADEEAKSSFIEAQIPPDAPELPLDTPDWLRSLGGMAEQGQSADSIGSSVPASSEPEAPDFSSLEIPAWMKSENDDEKPLQDTTPPWLRDEPASSEGTETPSWLSSAPTIVPSGQEDAPAQESEPVDLPEWLKAAAPQDSVFAQPEEPPAVELEPSSETPDWLDTFKTVEQSQPEAAPIFEESVDTPATFTSDSPAAENMDDLFTEMPDWLSNAMDAPDSSSPTPITNEDAVAPSELPSWVQAMRPVDSGVLQSSSLSSDQTLESRGALAGLQGVLPAVPGYAPTSKPKAYSIKLNASDEQLAHAELLEQILAAETAPESIESLSTLRTSRSLRWTISLLILTAILLMVSMRSQFFSMPVGVPNEVRDVLSFAQSLPQNAAVLVAIDYEPSRVGEMEAAAAPMLDQIVLFSHPRLTFISTNETGAILAERFITGPLADHYKNSGFIHSNLGYLPGGQLGVRAFGQNPVVTAPFDTSLQPAWTSPALEGVTTLSQFAALILITDNADAARVWTEQTETTRGDIPFYVIASAQAAPMIQPYYDSGQLNGVVPGLYGGAIFEQYNAGRPGTARSYWDAYSLGMLLAMALVLGGGLWNLALGLRDRAAAREEK